MSATKHEPLTLTQKIRELIRLLRFGLLGRFVLVLGCVGLIPLVIIPWLVNLTREAVTDQILMTHSVAARSTAARVDGWIRSIRVSAQTISLNPFLLHARRDQAGEILAGLLQADPSIKGVMVVNSRGEEAGAATLHGFADVVDPALAAASKGPVEVVAGDRLWIKVTTPLAEGKGEMRMLVDGSSLADVLKTEEIGRDAITGLFDADGQMMANSNVTGDLPHFPRALIEVGKTRVTSGASRYPEDDQVLAGAHSPVATAPWFVASSQPATVAEKAATDMRRKGLLSVLLAIALTTIFSALGYVAVIKPINQVVRSQWKAAKRRGEADTGNEITQLKNAFDAMRRQTVDREAIGKLFVSRYLVLDILGTGGMGSVFRGWDPKLERPVAIKTVHMGDSRASVGASEQRSVLLKEAVTVAKFNHPNIVAIYDVEDGGEAAFLAMEFIDGMSLESVLGRGGNLRVEQAVPLVIQIARGLEAAHGAGVVHCDIKPANILLGRDGAVKVTDFGIARSLIRATANISGTFGTPGYLPPEALTSTTFTPATDLYSLGTVFYEMLTGAPPHVGKTPQETLVKTATMPAISLRERNKSIPPAVDDIVLGLLEKDPRRRDPSSARDLADRLESIAEKNGWKWTLPPILEQDPSGLETEIPTAALVGPAKVI